MIKEHCALFGVTRQFNAVETAVFGLFALQHRGEEASGLVSIAKEGARFIKGMGKVSEVFHDNNILPLKDLMSIIGHNRYSVTGANAAENIQPFIGATLDGAVFALAHNGNLTNINSLKEELLNKGVQLSTTSDTELILQHIAVSDEETFEAKLIKVLSKLEGSFSLLVLTGEKLYAVRDPKGMRPLSIAQKDDAFAFASESCAFDLIRFKYLRDLEPGEIVSVDHQTGTLRKVHQFSEKKHAKCVFELIYFSRPDSFVFDRSVYEFRKKLGEIMAKRFPVAHADIVMPIPDSGVYAAIGYAQASGIPYEHANIRNHYVGRSFIQPSQERRQWVARLKHNPVSSMVKGKKIVVIDDSIVRGITSKNHIELLKHAGAKEIHLRITSPPILNPCFYGIDFPTKEELIANNMTLKEIEDFIGVDSLEYLPLEILSEMAPDEQFCTACFSGKYPIPIRQNLGKEVLK